MPTRTQAIKNFLTAKTHKDLANLYNHNMECQVNVAQDGGERVDGEFKGREWHGWSDGATTWKSFRIPYKAATEPEYVDREIHFDLAEHAEGIGMTGWDWYNKVSKWVAFDFDAITGHSDKHAGKLTNEELEAVKNAAFALEWITIRKSTSGQGLHFYVYLNDVPTKNHNEHAALARAIIGKMTALTGFDFKSKVDICGGNMWVWHRKMQDTDGLHLLKEGTVLHDVPPNWRDHVKVITGRRRKNLPQDIEGKPHEELFEELAGQRYNVPLDEDHKKLIEFLKESNAYWWWDQDHHMLVTHTIHLKEAHEHLQLKGLFETTSKGKERGKDHNCFAFPLRKGAWGVRRYSPGVQEHESWDQDGSGWTRCYLNKEPDLGTVCRACGGLEDTSGGFVFREAESAIKAARLLGVHINIATALAGRPTILKEHKDGRLIAQMDHDPNDLADKMPGWLAKRNKWTKIFNTQLASPKEPEVGNYDDLIRHLVTDGAGEDYGWMLKSDNRWRAEPLSHARIALMSLGIGNKDVNNILGSSVQKAWRIVNKPFQSEYPGDREWNRNAAQLKYLPTQESDNLKFPHWKSILDHCGFGLNDSIKEQAWCRANGLETGSDYLKCWIASLFKEPLEPLPYLFFYGPQNSGKSIFWEALSLLLTKGFQRSDAALISQSGFNGELEGAVLCVVEETDLKKDRQAYNRIKDWVTSRELLIHCKGKTPYHIPNSTHWIQCANDYTYCPIFPGDTRITMCYVENLDPLVLIPKKQLIPLLEKEASDFLAEILRLDLPMSNDRLNVPVIETADKIIAEQLNQTPLQSFISERCQIVPGYMIKFSDFFDKFQEWLEPNEVHNWTKTRVGRELPPQCPRARVRKTGQFHIGNITWAGDPNIEKRKKLVRKVDYLESNDD